jgi:ABC-type transport system involved in multi-copper enzyme maturation permease subunit
MMAMSKANSTILFGRFVMVASTLVMAVFLIVGGLLMGAGGTGVFGEPVSVWHRIVGILTMVCGAVLLPMAAMMARRAAKPYVTAAIGVVVVELVGYALVQHAVPMFGVVYAVILAVGFKLAGNRG